MPLVILGLDVEHRRRIKGMGGKWGKVQRITLEHTAWWWHRERLLGHFTPGNESRYRMKPRTAFTKRIKLVKGEGQGRFVSLLLKGRSLRWLKQFASVTTTSGHATLRMRAPGYFSRPFVGSWVDPQTGRRKVITQQPNKVEELLAQSADDKRLMVRFSQRELSFRFALAVRGAG